MIERLAEFLGEHGCVVAPDAMAYLARQPDPEAHLHALLSTRSELPFYLTLNALQELERVPATPDPVPSGLGFDAHAMALLAPAVTSAPPPLAPQRAGHATAAEEAAQVELVKDFGGRRATEGQLQDFVRYFNDRFETLSKLLRRRREVANAVPIRQAHAHGRDVQVIGFVGKTKATPNGHLLVDLEDDTGSVTVLLHQNTPHLVGEGHTLVPDEVIGVVASPAKDGGLLMAKELVRPDLPLAGPRTDPDLSLCAAVLSDIHVGSKTFLPAPFARMVNWLHGRSDRRRDRELAARVKYLVLAGDLVDGIGVYPGQEAHLEMDAILPQYAALAKLLNQLPDHIHLIVQPGNHDAVRPTEPQTPFGSEVRELFADLDATFVANPSTFRLHGVEVLAYHGFSMIDFATRIPGLRMDQPLPIMRRMLQGRHLAPTYGASTPLSPEERDYLVLDRVPNLFITGHVHVSGIDQYRGVSLVNSGTWQDQTDYQRTHNLVPTPARMPVVDLGTLNGTLVDFSP